MTNSMLQTVSTVTPTMVPVERWGMPEDIGGLVLFLVSRAVCRSADSALKFAKQLFLRFLGRVRERWSTHH